MLEYVKHPTYDKPRNAFDLQTASLNMEQAKNHSPFALVGKPCPATTKGRGPFLSGFTPPRNQDVLKWSRPVANPANSSVNWEIGLEPLCYQHSQLLDCSRQSRVSVDTEVSFHAAALTPSYTHPLAFSCQSLYICRIQREVSVIPAVSRANPCTFRTTPPAHSI